MCGLECYASQKYRWSAPDVAEGLNACPHRRKRTWQATAGRMCGFACYVLQKHHCRATAMAEERTVRLHHLHLAVLSHACERARHRDVDVRLWVRLPWPKSGRSCSTICILLSFRMPEEADAVKVVATLHFSHMPCVSSETNLSEHEHWLG